jgi:hypothetical protein
MMEGEESSGRLLEDAAMLGVYSMLLDTRIRPLEDGGGEGRLAGSRDVAILGVGRVCMTLPEDECTMEDAALIADEKKMLSRPPPLAAPGILVHETMTGM